MKSEFQRWLLFRIFGAVLLSSLMAALVLYFYARKEVGDSFYDAHIAIRHVSDLLWPVIAAGSTVSLISGMFLAIFLPQKIAGPIFRIEQDLRAVQKGDLTVVIHLREHDTMKEFAGNINQTIESLRLKIKSIQDGYAELENTQALQEMEGSLKVAHDELKSFKTQ
ncbi:MAG TPA: methyl-accepting chemotaxis protein [Deltaproteobacteria bacterium]|nr:methyl-accepting chemotaxis protein [Deltaproteobacteria bacterium]